MWDTMELVDVPEAQERRPRLDLALVILLLLGSGCSRAGLGLKAHVDYEVAVVFVIMGDVVYQHGAADGVGRASAINIGDLHWLQEVGIGGGCVDWSQ